MYVEQFYQNYKFVILLQVFPCIPIQDFFPKIYHNIKSPWGVGEGEGGILYESSMFLGLYGFRITGRGRTSNFIYM